jgi:hypothetical protein
MKTVYYAHCIAIYGTPQEDRDVATLRALGLEVFTPNSEECARGYQALGMEFFRDLVAKQDVFAFRAMPDGSIPAGVGRELEWAKLYGKPIIELTSGSRRRLMTIGETREYLKEIGKR